MLRESAAGDVGCRSARSLPKATEGGLARLRSALEGPIDTAEIPEAKGAPSRVPRDASGRLATKERPSPIREAILKELGRRQMTRYELWKAARDHCTTLPQSAVYEYLRGQREIGLPYAEALMAAVGLGVTRSAAIK